MSDIQMRTPEDYIMEDAPNWARVLYDQNARILETHVEMARAVAEVKPVVMEVVNDLQNNPMLKMFLGGKKRDGK